MDDAVIVWAYFGIPPKSSLAASSCSILTLTTSASRLQTILHSGNVNRWPPKSWSTITSVVETVRLQTQCLCALSAGSPQPTKEG